MGLFRNNANGAQSVIDKNSAEYAVRQFGIARGNLLLAVVLTAVNIVLGLAGSNTYLLFSISFPYYEFSTDSVFGIVLPVLALGFYLCCYVVSKKRPGFMIAAMVAFILDCLYLVGISYIVTVASEGEVSYADYLLDYLFHIWVVVYLIIGVRYCRRYRATLHAPQVPAPFAAYPEGTSYPPVGTAGVPQPQTVPEAVNEIIPEPVDDTAVETEE